MREALFVLIISAIVPLTIDAYIEHASWCLCPTCGNKRAASYRNSPGEIVCFNPSCPARGIFQAIP